MLLLKRWARKIKAKYWWALLYIVLMLITLVSALR
jgi:hypothetical protein